MRRLYPDHAIVTPVAAAYAEDAAFAHEFFSRVEPIERSAMDVAQFKIPRKLPLLFDVPAAGRRSAGPDDYLVFTNSDICLLLGFYDTIATLVGFGHDAVIVNRRTVEAFPLDPNLAPVMATSLGSNHPGFDCFIFRAGLFDNFTLGDAVIGRGWVMRPLIYNLVAKARRMLILKEIHLTYHLGDDRAWSGEENADYNTHNLMEAWKLLATSSPGPRAAQRILPHPPGNLRPRGGISCALVAVVAGISAMAIRGDSAQFYD